MKRLLLIGFAVLAIPVAGIVLILAAFAVWDNYYWWAASDLAKAFRASASESVRAEPIERLTGLSIEDAQARAEAAEFSCFPQQDGLHCARFIGDIACSEDWYLVLETVSGRVAEAVGTKHATCIEADGTDEKDAQ